MPTGESGFGARSAIAVALVLAFVAGACGGGRGSVSSNSPDKPPVDRGDTSIETSRCATDPSARVIEGDTIKVGTSLPQSGLYSAFSEILAGEQAFVRYLNEGLGGVEVAGKRYRMELVDMDDRYAAAETVANVNELVTEENVFAIFGVVGTKNNLAIRDFLDEACVPNLFASTGSPAWGNHDYPWTLGSFNVPYSAEVKAFVDYLREEDPDATIALLRASDDFGKAYSETLRSLVAGTDLRVVKEERYNAEVFDTRSQVTSLAATDADVLFLGATLLACPDAMGNVGLSGWDPLIYMSGTCASRELLDLVGPTADGVITVAPMLDPAVPENDSDAEMRLYKEKVAQYSPGTDTTNGIVLYGWTQAAMLAELLRRSPALDRLSVMETARNLTDLDVGPMLDGATFDTGPDDWYLGETFTLVRYDAGDGYAHPIGGLLDYDGKTAGFTPPELIDG